MPGERRKCAGGCGRWLSDPASLARGYGRLCAERRGIPVHTPRRPVRPRPPAVRSPDAPSEPIPGQEALPLQPMQPSLWSL
ncbi:hypothetical protein GCM10023220_67010 [Streptomyces ziwulingensis]|uniref:Uncharacterized protein n=1 Tax=Streptomyces ziwulingensis TaxID=1045501 RepID=A0ABP9D400_9ACTN